MAWTRAIPVVLFAAAAVFITKAVASGGASVSLFLVIPVISGGSPFLAGGVACLVAGFFTLPLVFGGAGSTEREVPLGAPATARPDNTDSSGGTGGLVLLGPIPIFFGSWRHPTRARYWWAVAAGAVLLAAAVVTFWLLFS